MERERAWEHARAEGIGCCWFRRGGARWIWIGARWRLPVGVVLKTKEEVVAGSGSGKIPMRERTAAVPIGQEG